ncbi:MAG TPA: ribose-5-phosphate isomerase RpiA [Myxococcota bacterium]|nr:ribose-5-phosphate isomerase RpiA [Myxococcota bacterium]
MTVAERALELVEDGQVVGLGTGRAAAAFVEALAARMKEGGLRVQGVPTSLATESLARELGIPLLEMSAVDSIDVTFDGADEVDPALDVIKGYGAALVREKIVATASRKLVILVGHEKLVARLGQRGKLPVEVVPFGVSLVRARLAALGFPADVRRGPDGEPLVSDNGNWILDCRVERIPNPAQLDTAILAIPGVVGTGLFVGMADVVLVQDGDHVEARERPH